MARKRAVWGASSPEIARTAEILAATKILPRIGFTDLVYVAAMRRLVPFDIVGTLDSQRTLIDVTTGWWKGGRYLESAISLAEALRMKIFILFVKPDLRHFALKLAEKGGGVYCSLKDLRTLRE